MKIPELTHLTCVYTINDPDAFKPEMEAVLAKHTSSNGKPWAITALSRGHELDRLEYARGAVDANRIELLDEILNRAEISSGMSLDDFAT